MAHYFMWNIQAGQIHGSYMRTNSTFHFINRWKQHDVATVLKNILNENVLGKEKLQHKLQKITSAYE